MALQVTIDTCNILSVQSKETGWIRQEDVSDKCTVRNKIAPMQCGPLETENQVEVTDQLPLLTPLSPPVSGQGLK
ncbi:hypothetical protein ABBQ32_009125 [Trebouxia sp. C0010 RCD-2024]